MPDQRNKFRGEGMMRMKTGSLLAALLLFASASAVGQPAPVPATPGPQTPKPATEATRAANAAVLQALPFADQQDFEDARRGLIESPATLTIPTADGKRTAWDIEAYRSFIKLDAPAPDSVNPSLWRMAQLNMFTGLFKVTDEIYQVRNYDLSNITFIRGKTGWIVFDPLISAETAKAALDLVSKNLGKRPVVAVVYSHSHADHYGGVRGITTPEEVAAGRVQVIAPEGFLKHAISENVIAGNAMSRRAVLMFGALLPVGPTGGVTAGLGQRTSGGSVGLIAPTREVKTTGEEITIDGVRMVFQMTPGTEAPAQMNTFFPDQRAMWMAENTTNVMHNILTLRGAEVRDAKFWAEMIDQTIRLYGKDIDVKFQSHHWPKWGNAAAIDYLRKQRDLYKYMHDQTVRLMNMGLTGPEIAEVIRFPPELETFWSGRGYYGTLKHNSRAIYQRYMGWYDGNPVNLDSLPPEPAARKYVEYMGGPDAILARARTDFEKGDYRWVAEAVKHVVFADPANTAARQLLADSLEQMGYQAESGPWRSVYLQGAYELRNGTPTVRAASSGAPDVLAAMPPDMLFDLLAVRLNGPRAAGRKLGINLTFTDLNKSYGLSLENAVLNHGPPLPAPDSSFTLTKATLDRIQLGQLTFPQALAAGDIRFEGDPTSFADLMELIEAPPFWFNIVTP
jgi:alkyl sulfatase BDS1-like metallo-beta-lactamase superfamily hydrolase